MPKPFSDLASQVMAILASGGDPLQSQNEAVKKYWQWRLNPTDDSHDLPDESTRTEDRQLEDVYIEPFGVDLPDKLYAKVTISKRSLDFFTAKFTDLGVKATLADGEIGLKLGDFTPARVYARTGGATAPQERISRITGRKYKSYYARTDQGYSAPFGTKGTTLDYFTRTTEVETAVKDIATVKDFVTFSPEKTKV